MRRLLLLAALLLLPSSVSAQHRVLVILVNYQDRLGQPFTVSHVRSHLAASSADFQRFAYGDPREALVVDVVGYFTVPLNMGTQCFTSARIADLAPAQAQAVAQVGSTAWASYTAFLYVLNVACGNSFALGTTVYSRGLDQTHEFGHAIYRWQHSTSRLCNAGVCTFNAYGDRDDVMGSGDQSKGHPNLLWKRQAGWLTDTRVVRVQTGVSGQYAVDAYETISTKPKAIVVPIGPDVATWNNATSLWIESRGPGIVRLRSNLGNIPYVIDLDPGAGTDLQLDIGQHAIVGGVDFSTVSASTSGAMVAVNFTPGSNPCGADPLVLTIVVTGSHPIVGWKGTVTATDDRGCQKTVTQ